MEGNDGFVREMGEATLMSRRKNKGRLCRESQSLPYPNRSMNI